MIDTAGLETALIIFAAVLAALVAVGTGLIVSTVRRDREEAAADVTRPAPERTRELVG